MALTKAWRASLRRFWMAAGMGDFLAVRLVVAIILFSAAGAVLTTGIQSYVQYHREMEQIQSRFAEFRKLQVPVLADGVWEYDDEQINIQLKGITQIPYIESACVRVRDAVKWSSGKAESQHLLVEKIPLFRRERAAAIAQLEIYVSLDQVYDRLWQRALSILLQNAVQTLGIAIFALFFFQKSVTRHIYRMADYARQLDIQKMDVPDLELLRPKRRSPDVLDQLAASINTMRQNLTNAYRDLSAYTAEVLENKKKFSAIFHSLPVALSVSRFHEQYFLLEVNEAWERQFGMPREYAVGRDIGEAHFWKNPEECSALLSAVEASGETHGHEAWRRRGDGQELLCEISARLFEVGGECLLLLAEMDITVKRQIEQEILDLNIRLETRVEQRTAELQAANDRLTTAMEHLQQAQGELLRREKLAALGALVAGIAHELNTPIGNSLMVSSTLSYQTEGINQAFLSGLKRSELENYLAETTEACEQLQRNLNRASELINSFKQVAVDQTSSQRREFQLKDVIQEILMTLRPMTRKTPYAIECDIPESIVADSYPGPLGQVVTNLVHNAILHGFDGAPQGRIRIEAVPVEADQIRLTISDDGKGIPEAHLRRIFDPFFTTKLGQGGSGLGLNVVHNIVTGVLGGHISVESGEGRGTSFTMVFPRVAPAASPDV